MHGVAEHDEEGVGRRVEHQRRAREAGVPGGARRGHRAHVPVLVELEAEAVLVAGEGGVEVGEHQLHRLGPQDPRPPVDTAVEQRTAEDREVPRVGEDARVARDPAEAEGVLVVHLAPHQAPVQAGPRRARVLRGRDPRPPGDGRVVAGAAHAERRGDLLPQEGVQGTARDPFQHELERDEVQVRVQIRRARSAHRLLVPDELELLLVRRRAVQRDPGAETRGVREELTDRDVLLARACEVRQVRGDLRLQRQPAPLDLLHGEDRGEQLRHRRQVEDGVLGHGDLLVRRELHTGVGLLVVGPVAHRHPEGPVQCDGAAAPGEQDGARVPGVCGGGAEERLGVADEPAKVRGEQAGACGRAVPQGGVVTWRRGGRRGPGGQGGESERTAQGQGPSAQLPPGRFSGRRSVCRSLGHRTPLRLNRLACPRKYVRRTPPRI